MFDITIVATDASDTPGQKNVQVTVLDAVNPIFTGFGVAPVTPLIEVDAGSTSVHTFGSTDQSSVTFTVDNTYGDGADFIFDGATSCHELSHIYHSSSSTCSLSTIPGYSA